MIWVEWVKNPKKLKIIGYIVPIIAYIGIFAAISVSTDWFTWEHNALSDLGAHAGSNIIFNSALIISGLLLFFYTLHIYYYHEHALAYTGGFVFSLSGIFLALIGVFPEQYHGIHYNVSVGFFVTFPIGMFLFSLYLWLYKKNYTLLLLGVLAFIGSLIIWTFPWRAYNITGVAIPEFTSSLLGVIWLLYYNSKIEEFL